MTQAANSKSPSRFAIFLNNKIITCDTAVPLVMDVHRQNPEMTIEFYVGDWKTFQMIRANRVLWDAIHRTGRLIFYGRSDKDRARGLLGWIVHRARALAMLACLSIAGISGTAIFMHFRALNHWPLRFLHLVNGRNTYLCEGIVTGYSENERRIDNSWAQRVDHHANIASRGGLIGFSSEWRHFLAQQHANTKKYVLGTFWYGTAWPDFVNENADVYLQEEFHAAGLEPTTEIIVYILGYLGAVESVPDSDTFKKLLHLTLTVLREEAPLTPVFIKPHFNTDIDYVREMIAEFEEHRFVISHLHPAVLSTRARFLVANYYSTTMAVAHTFGVPVVEYSNYGADARKITGNGTIRPDIVEYYVDNDQDEFRVTVRKILDSPHTPPKVKIRSDDTGIIRRLAGKSD